MISPNVPKEKQNNQSTPYIPYKSTHVTDISQVSIFRILDKSNSRCLEQNNRSHTYQCTQNEYSISRTLDVSNKFVGPLIVRDIES